MSQQQLITGMNKNNNDNDSIRNFDLWHTNRQECVGEVEMLIYMFVGEFDACINANDDATK